MRNSRVAVLPRIFFTSAEFCSPGNWMAMRSTPSLRHLRFGYRQFRTVEAIAQDDDVLLDRVGLALLDLLRRQLQFQRRRAARP